MNKQLFLLFLSLFILSSSGLVLAQETTSIKLTPRGSFYYDLSFENKESIFYQIKPFISDTPYGEPFQYGNDIHGLVFIEGNFSEQMTLAEIQQTKDVFNIGTDDIFLLSNVRDPSGYDENAITRLYRYVYYNPSNNLFFIEDKSNNILLNFTAQQIFLPDGTPIHKITLPSGGENYDIYSQGGNIAVDMNADGKIDRAEIRVTTLRGGVMDLGTAKESDSGDSISTPTSALSVLTKQGLISGLPTQDETVTAIIEIRSPDELGIASVTGTNFTLQPPQGIFLTNYNTYLKFLTKQFYWPIAGIENEALTFTYPLNNFRITLCGFIPVDGCFVTQSLTLQPGTYSLSKGIEIQSPDVTLDCNGATLDGSTATGNIGVHISGVTRTTLKNCNLHNFDEGVLIDYSNFNRLNNLVITSNKGRGVALTGILWNTTFSNSRITTSSSNIDLFIDPQTQNLKVEKLFVNDNTFDRIVNSNQDATLYLLGLTNFSLIRNTISSSSSGTAVVLNGVFGIQSCDLTNNNILAQPGTIAVQMLRAYCNIQHNYIEGSATLYGKVFNNTIKKHGILTSGANFVSNTVQQIDGINIEDGGPAFTSNIFLNNRRGVHFKYSGSLLNVSNNVFNNLQYDALLDHPFAAYSFRNNSFSGGVIDRSLGSDYCTERNYFAPGIKRPSWSYCDCVDNDQDSTFVYDALLCPIGNDCDDTNPNLIGVAESTPINHDVKVCSGYYNIEDERLNGIFLMNNSGITLDCNRATINGTDFGIGIYIKNKTDNIIKNCNIQHYSYGIDIVSARLQVPLLYRSTNNTITNNTFLLNNPYGLSLGVLATNNLIYNNYFDNPINAIANNTNHWNITKALGTNIVGGPYIGGNFWSDYTGIDTDGDGIGNTNIPYTAQGNIQQGGDYLPLVTTISAPTFSIQGNPTLGNTLTLTLSDPSSPNKPYLLLMSLGNTPGITLIDGRVIPLNYDLVLLNSLYYPQLMGLNQSFGILDNTGKAVTTWTIPNTPLLEDITFYIAGMTLNPSQSMPQLINTISNSASVQIKKN